MHSGQLAAAGAEEDPYRRAVALASDRVVDDVYVEVELAGVLRLEAPGLQLHHHVPVQVHVVEEEVDEELLPVDLQAVLGADEGETCTQLDQETLELGDERLLEVALVYFGFDVEELQIVRVLGYLLDGVGFFSWQGGGEVGRSRAHALVKLAHDPVEEYVPRPTVGRRLTAVPVPQRLVVQLVQEYGDVPPRQSSNRVLDHLRQPQRQLRNSLLRKVGPRPCERLQWQSLLACFPDLAEGHHWGCLRERCHCPSDRFVPVLGGVLVTERCSGRRMPAPVHQLGDRGTRCGRPRQCRVPQVMGAVGQAGRLEGRQPHPLAEVDAAKVAALRGRENHS